MSSDREGIIQIFNADNDPLYLELRAGNAHWVLPRKYKLGDVKYLSHLTDENTCYFENLETNETSWELPTEMSEQAKNNAVTFQKMTRDETEIALLDAFPEEESAEQMAKIDAFYDPDSEMRGVEVDDHDNEDGDEEEKDEGPSVHLPDPAMLMRRHASTAHDGGDHSSDEEDAEDALAKLGRPSLARDSGDGGRISPPVATGPVAMRTIESVRATTIKVTTYLSRVSPHPCVRLTGSSYRQYRRGT